MPRSFPRKNLFPLYAFLPLHALSRPSPLPCFFCSYLGHLFYIAKVERARAFLAKHPLPEEEKPAKKGRNYIVPVDPNLSDFYTFVYPVTKIEDPEMLEKLRNDPSLIVGAERAKAIFATYGLPKDKTPKQSPRDSVWT
jgi:hypothetical protein